MQSYQMFTPAEIAVVIEAAKDYGQAPRRPALVALFTVLANLGVRVTEALSLTWADVDLERAELTVQTLKQRRPRRDVLPINPATKAALLVLKNGGRPQDRIFPFSRHVVYNILQALLNRTGLPRRRVHAFRHACATRLLKQTNDLVFVRDIMRHANISTTSGYLHCLDLKEKYLALPGVS